MPFTFSHPALVVPLLHARRRFPWLSATGLITGSIAPDFEKFFKLRLASTYSHTAASIFYFSCPVGLALALVFHWQVRRPLLTHLPAPLHRRLGRWAQVNWFGYFRQHPWGVLLSIGLGAALHLLWDSFTHVNAWMMRWLPGLGAPVNWGFGEVALFEALGLVSSVGGMLAIGWAVWRMPARPAGPVPALTAVRRYWGLAALVGGALVIEWLLAVEPELLDGGIAAISAALLGVVAASVYTNYASRRSRAPQAKPQAKPQAGPPPSRAGR